ncbi:hypothetical protein D1007_42158 [Hordeum vulgare]|nr:hypothetical protein D1007_42158 [Hordeum vulgare]
MYQFKYEKLPTFCYHCGEFGHWHEECGEGEHDEAAFEWGDFLFAENVRFWPFGRGGPSQRGRGSAGPGGRGRGRTPYDPSKSWRFNAQHNQTTPASEDPTVEREATMVAVNQMPVELTMKDTVQSNKQTSVENRSSSSTKERGGEDLQNQLELVIREDSPSVPPLAPFYDSSRKDSKRPKNAAKEKKTDNVGTGGDSKLDFEKAPYRLVGKMEDLRRTCSNLGGNYQGSQGN